MPTTPPASSSPHPRQPRRSGALDRFWSQDWSLTALLVFLVFMIFIAGPLEGIGIVGHIVLGIVFAMLLLSGVAAIAKTRIVAILFSVAGLVSVGVNWFRYVSPDQTLDLANTFATLVSCGMLAVIVLVHVFREGPVTVHRIQGAIAVYLLLGLVWSGVYELIYLSIPNSFNFTAVPTGTSLAALRPGFAYFSFTTLTTVGYGDITAVAPAARSAAMLEAITGQLFPAVLLARLVSLELYHRQRRDPHE